MDNIDSWRLCDDFTIVQAALLIANADPRDEYLVEDWQSYDQPSGYNGIRTALKNAVSRGTLPARIVIAQDTNYTTSNSIETEFRNPDIHKTTIAYQDIQNFLRRKGFTEGFFFQDACNGSINLKTESFDYPPKLAAAIRAYNEVKNNPFLCRGKSPKQALQDWLKSHATELNLLKKNGKPNLEGIEQICKVANWQPEGGATPTPAPLPQSIISDSDFLEDDIPF